KTRAGLLDALRARFPDMPIDALDWFVTRPETPCAGQFYQDVESGEILGGFVFLSAEIGGLLRRACIEEEMAQMMGLTQDHPEVRPSIFNDDNEFALLTRHDEELLRLLYDPRLRAGMTRAEAAPIVRRIALEIRGAASPGNGA
ncbi:MAG: DUF2927 domain-containing protein, partial [Pseudomonadota bacterium]